MSIYRVRLRNTSNALDEILHTDRFHKLLKCKGHGYVNSG